MTGVKQIVSRLAAGLLFHSRVLRLLRGRLNQLVLRTGEDGRPAFPFLKRSRGRNLQILSYHRVSDQRDSFLPALGVRRFEAQMEYLASDFRVLSLEEAVARLEAGELPDHALVVTFDDGYRDNYRHAFPVLRRLAIPASFFLTTGAIGSGGLLWHDRVFHAFRQTALRALTGYPEPADAYPLTTPENRRGARQAVLDFLRTVDSAEQASWVERLERALAVSPPTDGGRLMLSWEEVREMHRAGFSFGAHTVGHPILTRLSLSGARREMRESKEAIEAALGAPVQTFAYPNGSAADFGVEHKEALRDLGFRCALTTIFGVNRPGDDLFELRRISPWARNLSEFAARLNYYKLLP
jgi:peptidoglycan/xylan/chitin deacetylase (PgdA/CDA1 family)